MNETEEGKVTELTEVRDVDYEINDTAFAEPLQVFKPIHQRQSSWWSSDVGGRGKVELLINAFKMDFTIQEACIYSAITIDQYRYFCVIHPQFSIAKSRLKELIVMSAKQGLVGDVQTDASTRKWILERKQPETYGNKQFLPVMPTDAETLATLTKSAFLDKDGKVLISKDSLEVITKHG